MAEKRVKLIAENTAASFGAVARVNYKRGYPSMVNAEAQTAFAIEVAKQVVGDGKVDPAAPALMTAEDFAFMLQARPGAYILLGNGDTATIHHPKYNFDDEAIPAGCSYWATLIEAGMPAI